MLLFTVCHIMKVDNNCKRYFLDLPKIYLLNKFKYNKTQIQGFILIRKTPVIENTDFNILVIYCRTLCL